MGGHGLDDAFERPSSKAPTRSMTPNGVKPETKTTGRLRKAGWASMGLGLLGLGLAGAIGLAPGALLIFAGSYMLARGGARPLE